ncbi:MAG: type VII toxin-antitoxin system MntA family adenylyltransferase antitoxin [Thiobacillus sp.]
MSETVASPWIDTSGEALNSLRNVLAATAGLAFAVLVGSRADNRARPDSDWDIALQWRSATPWMQTVGDQETLRRRIAETLNVSPDRIDLIDLPRANLAMRANAAENGRVLKGEDTLEWAHFLTRTWRELEDFYWEQSHAS